MSQGSSLDYPEFQIDRISDSETDRKYKLSYGVRVVILWSVAVPAPCYFFMPAESVVTGDAKLPVNLGSRDPNVKHIVSVCSGSQLA